MNVLIHPTKHLPGSMPSYAPVGWAMSAVVHAAGALITWAACATMTPLKSPELAGNTVRVELLARWAKPQEPPVTVEIALAQPQVVVMPKMARVGRRTYRSASADVSQPTAEESAWADYVMSLPVAAEPRREDFPQRHPGRVGASSVPPISRQPAEIASATVEVKGAVSSLRRQAVGTNDQTPPRLLENRPPTYPARALVDRMEGTVLLRLQVAGDGRVAEVEVFTSSGHRVLDAAAVRAVRSWRFAPARRGGRPVAATVRLPVRFALD